MTAPRHRWFRFSLRNILLALLVALALAWPVFYLAIYLGYGNYQVRGHQAFAKTGVSQIAPASQMKQLFPDCRNYITYGADSNPIWNSVAFFGGRYELTMQVPVAIESSTKGHATGAPQFFLNELSAVNVSPSGQVQATFSRGLNFGTAEWQKVVAAEGDFGTIGFKLKTGPPVIGFATYINASR